MKLSIIIPNYNYAHFLPICLDSILSFEGDYEVIVVDDGSTDDSSQVLASYAARYPHFRYIQSPKNQGIFKANFEGLEVAHGEYLHFFSADDYLHPDFLPKVMEVIERESPSLVCSDIGYLRGETVESKPILKGQSKPRFYSAKELPDLMRDQGFWIPGLTSVVRREMLEKYGWLDPKLENISDWYFYTKVALFEGVGYIPQTLVTMRLHDKTYTSQVKRDKKRQRATYHHLLNHLITDHEARERFVTSGLLRFVFRDLKWRLYLKPRYRVYWPYTAPQREPKKVL